MSKLYLSQPAVVSSLGEGLAAHISTLLSGAPSTLSLCDTPFTENGLSDNARMYGAVNVQLRPFQDTVPDEHRSRNNQLLWHCLTQLETQIEQAIQIFGKHRIAVVVGTSTTGVDENIALFKQGAEYQDWSCTPFKQQQQYFSAPADFVAWQYGLDGLCYGISTACTSGARALMSAARLLKNNLCDAVICGGVDTLSPLTIKGFQSLSVLSDSQTNPLSANRKGINIGEGAAMFVLSKQPLGQSVELLGYGASSDAYHMSSPHPEGEGAIAAFRAALANSQLAADEIGWINLHGTGTLHNDQMEILAVHNVFGENTPCTTTKPYTGHTLGAAGAVEAAILWGMIHSDFNPEGKLPPQLWDGEPDPALPKVAITDDNSRWTHRKRIGASSSFAFGGNNTVIILGESDV